jgi:hypothetical protein
MDNYEKERLSKKIRRIYKNGKLNNKNIVLFGVSPAAKEVKNALSNYEIFPESIIDNDPRRIGKKCMGLTVQTPEDRLSAYDDNAVILVISYAYYKEMAYQLKSMGYRERKNFFILNVKIDDSLFSFFYMCFRLIRGLIIYRKLLKTGCETIFTAPYTGTGDIYLSGLYLGDYLKQNNIKKYVFVIVSGACKKTASIFNFENVVQIKPKYADDLIKLNDFNHKSLNIITLNDGWNNDIQWLRGYNGLNFEHMFRHFVFGFDDSYKLKHPKLTDRQTEVDDIFEEYGLIKNKTVILAPYSNTLFDLPTDFLEEVTEIFASKGYVVCTNCAGKEKPVNGTKSVFFPLDLAKQFMDNAGIFIGVRSGLCDIISNSSCKKIIFYEKDSFFYKSSSYDYFSLKAMGLCNDATEIEYSDDIKNMILDDIKESL